MPLQVSDKTRQRTEKCWREFVCLSDSENGPCAVRSCVRGVLFVTRRTTAYCPYDVAFGFSHICSCPTRQEVYDRYGV